MLGQRSRRGAPGAAPAELSTAFATAAQGCGGPRRVRCALAVVLQQACPGSGWTKRCGTSGWSPVEPQSVDNILIIRVFSAGHQPTSTKVDFSVGRCRPVGLWRTPPSYGRLRFSSDGQGARRETESYPQFGSARRSGSPGGAAESLCASSGAGPQWAPPVAARAALVGRSDIPRVRPGYLHRSVHFGCSRVWLGQCTLWPWSRVAEQQAKSCSPAAGASHTDDT
jgi:hypothetical protein